MELINLKSLNLTMEESRDIINFIAQKRGISTKKLLSTIKPNLKCKNDKSLTTKTQQKLTKTQQKLTKTQQKLTKTQQELTKSQQELIKSHQKLTKTQKNLTKTQKNTKIQKKSLKLEKCKNTQNLTYEKPSKLAKSENLTSQKQQILSKTKKRIETITEKLKELHHKLSKSELKKN